MSEYSNCWRLEAPNKILQITLSSSSCLSYETASLFFWYKMMIRGVLINPKKNVSLQMILWFVFIIE